MPQALLARLMDQLKASGHKGDVRGLAIALLRKAGDMEPNSTDLTVQGLKREALGAAGRAKARAARYAHGQHKAGDYAYNPRNNQAHLKGK